VNAFWAVGLEFHFHSLFLVSECWAGISFPFTFLFFFPFFPFLILTAAKKICINVFIIVNFKIGMAFPHRTSNALGG
jgi:hypothetical protein